MRPIVPVLVACAAVAVAAAAFVWLPCHPAKDGFPLDDPRWAKAGFSEVRFGSYADLQEGDFAYGTVLPALAEKAGHPVSGMVGLADVTSQGTYQVFVMLTDPAQCADGCRTLSYKWGGRDWRLAADEKAVSVMVTPGAFVYVTRNGGAHAWKWEPKARAYAPVAVGDALLHQ